MEKFLLFTTGGGGTDPINWDSGEAALYSVKDLKFIKTKEISEEGYKRICAIDREVRILKDKYTQRYINLLRQQHMI